MTKYCNSCESPNVNDADICVACNKGRLFFTNEDDLIDHKTDSDQLVEAHGGEPAYLGIPPMHLTGDSESGEAHIGIADPETTNPEFAGLFFFEIHRVNGVKIGLLKKKSKLFFCIDNIKIVDAEGQTSKAFNYEDLVSITSANGNDVEVTFTENESIEISPKLSKYAAPPGMNSSKLDVNILYHYVLAAYEAAYAFNRDQSKQKFIDHFDYTNWQIYPVMYMGGHGLQHAPHALNALVFTSHGVHIAMNFFPWVELEAYSVGGPGVFQTGGGWVGGGFGLGGAVKGAMEAGIMNAISTRMWVQTDFRLTFETAELNFRTSAFTPAAVEASFSPIRQFLSHPAPKSRAVSLEPVGKPDGEVINFCVNCGQSLKEQKANFCPNCGTNIRIS